MSKREPIIGIDLGTSTSEVAVFEDGIISVIPNHLGEMVTPSYVHFKENGEVLVGREAKELLLLHPESTFYEVKRLFGEDHTLTANGKTYSPEEVQSQIIAYLVRCASNYLKRSVTRAVITVPAYFSDRQRKQTVQAGELAGITVSRIINEPTAAALDYGLANLSDSRNMLVYDFGGGTLDVTVLELFEGVLDVKSTCGNNKLGGKDFDQCLTEHLTADHKPDLRSAARIKDVSEACKIALSKEDWYHAALPFLQNKKGQAFSIDAVVSREDLERLIEELVHSTQTQVETALEEARLNREDIDDVFLVGGSTKIPLVTSFLTEFFDGRPPKNLVDPELAVVRGAAVQAAIIAGDLTGELAITDICPFTLGTAVYDVVLDRKVYCPVIQKNTVIPVKKAKAFRTVADFQTRVNVTVYQGEYTNPEHNQLLGEFTLKGIPSAPAGNEPIECVFAYDINGILQVSAKVVSTGKEANVTISTTGVVAMNTADTSKWLEATGAKKYRPAIKKAEKLASSGSVFADEMQILTAQIKEALILGKDCEELYSDLLDLLEDL